MARNTPRVGLLTLILVVGAVMRLALAGVNPPNNSYDDHLTPIAIYVEEGERPAPDACWQCYHPPAYYALSAGVLTTIHEATGNSRLAWEAVQWTSALASIGSLVFSLLLLGMYLPRDRIAQAGGLLFVAVLPRDVYAAASMGNDALLVFFVTGAAYFFARLHERECDALAIGGLAVFALGAAWTKQSGLVVLGLVALAAWHIWRASGPDLRIWIVGALGLVGALALADEAWRFHETGIPLASNQHFDYRAAAEGQPPGEVTLSTFASFLPASLLEHPTLHQSTIGSFWTQIFARTWFDYEPRFLPGSPTATRLARFLYSVGFVGTGLVALGTLRLLRDGPGSARQLLLLPVGFIAAAIVQTVRFPHFSSMKALFVLPAVAVFALGFAYGVRELRSTTWGRRIVLGILVVLALVGFLHGTGATFLNSEALNMPTSPQWEFPALGSVGGA